MAYTDPEPDEGSTPLGIGGWIVIIVLVALLIGAGFIASRTWFSLDGVGISTLGWTFLILGVVVTTALGVGLMGLVFYSSRNKYDR